MSRPVSKFPTELEMEILKIMWREDAMTVRGVRDRLSEFRALAYTSVHTIMNIMTRKGYLDRSKEGRGYIYRAKVNQRDTTQEILNDIVDRLFHGSSKNVVRQLLETRMIEPGELEEIRGIIERKRNGDIQTNDPA